MRARRRPRSRRRCPRRISRSSTQLERSFRWGGYLFVHAGIRPGVPWDEQTDEDLFWIREEFVLHPHGLPETIVFGHTPARQPFVAAAVQDRHRHRTGLRRCAHRARAAGPRAAPGDGGRASRARQRVAGQPGALIRVPTVPVRGAPMRHRSLRHGVLRHASARRDAEDDGRDGGPSRVCDLLGAPRRSRSALHAEMP